MTRSNRNEKRIKDPLRKRLLREIKADLGKYIVIFALLFVSIGFVSGFLVAAGSMITTYNESFSKYNIEDGHFSLQNKANAAQVKAIESNDITIYELFYREIPLTNGSTLRVFKKRDSVNQECIMKGEWPDGTGEIVIDRMYADNNGIEIGNLLTEEDLGTSEFSGRSWKVTGFVALSDYSALFESNDDIMFDSIKFGVACVSAEEFSEMVPLTYCYAWKYRDPPESVEKEKEISDDLMENINKEVQLTEFVPVYSNQAIQFSGEDFGSDSSMMGIFLYIIVVITAFIYAVTMRDTINKESPVIGTLLASGYSKHELVKHYITLPIIVTLIAALIGNIFGYTVFKNICADIYYGSYSLPTYTTIWNAEAFVKTTLIPCVIMSLVSWLVLRRSLAFSPMNFLRRDLSRQKNKRALRLSKRIPFISRFRMRVTIQNIPGFLILFTGIIFANILLFFGLGLPQLLDHYQTSISESMLAEKQYILSIPQDAMDEDKKTESLLRMVKYLNDVETECEDAEKFSAYTLKSVPKGEEKSDEVMVYGISKNSRYVSKEIGPGEVYVSSLYADKLSLTKGDIIRLKEPYEKKEYEFELSGIIDYEGGIALFMDMDELNEKFDLPQGIFAGYFSDTEITDIPEKCIGSVIDFDSLTKVSRQLVRSFGSMVWLVDGFSVALFVLLIYLLSKMIIEKNSQSISMTKILGYSDSEVAGIYLVTTTIMVIVFILLSFPICYYLIGFLWRYFIALKMSGWIRYVIGGSTYIKMFVLGVLGYGIVAVLEFIKIKRIPMDQALKNVE